MLRVKQPSFLDLIKLSNKNPKGNCFVLYLTEMLQVKQPSLLHLIKLSKKYPKGNCVCRILN